MSQDTAGGRREATTWVCSRTEFVFLPVCLSCSTEFLSSHNSVGISYWPPCLDAQLHWTVADQCTFTERACRTDRSVFPAFISELCTPHVRGEWKKNNLVAIVYVNVQRPGQKSRFTLLLCTFGNWEKNDIDDITCSVCVEQFSI